MLHVLWDSPLVQYHVPTGRHRWGSKWGSIVPQKNALLTEQCRLTLFVHNSWLTNLLIVFSSLLDRCSCDLHAFQIFPNNHQIFILDQRFDLSVQKVNFLFLSAEILYLSMKCVVANNPHVKYWTGTSNQRDWQKSMFNLVRSNEARWSCHNVIFQFSVADGKITAEILIQMRAAWINNCLIGNLMVNGRWCGSSEVSY